MQREIKPDSVASVVALANRMLALKNSPGFHDLRLLVGMLEKEASETSRDYPGWDPQQIVILKVRAQVAHEMAMEIFARIEGAIANAKGLPGFQMDGAAPPLTERIAGSY